MVKEKRLFINGLPLPIYELFINTADAMELTRGQLLTLLMVGNGVVKSDYADFAKSAEWRELMLSRLFELSQL